MSPETKGMASAINRDLYGSSIRDDVKHSKIMSTFVNMTPTVMLCDINVTKVSVLYNLLSKGQGIICVHSLGLPSLMSL